MANRSKRVARHLQDLASEVLGKPPSYHRCLNIVRDNAAMSEPGEVDEVVAVRLFERFGERLK